METVIGTKVNRLDAPAKASGKAMYAGDYSMPGMLHVALVRAKKPHARILEIRVPELPEGIFCYTAADLPCNLLPSIMNDQPALAADRIRFYGEPVAVVAAEKLADARRFASLVEISCEDLPVVDDMRRALDPDMPKLFEGGNLCTECHTVKGDPEEALRHCDRIIEATYALPAQCHGFLEPEASFTYIDEKGRLALIASTQNAFADRRTLAQVLGRPIDTVTAKAAAVGGAFGGKDGNTSQIFPAIVTHFTGRPARYVFTREENIRCGMKRHAAAVRVRFGFTNEGIFKALVGEMRMDTGAYAVLGPAVLKEGLEHLTGPYYIPDVKLDGYLAYTNHAPASAMRGFGVPQGGLAIESLVDRAAEALGMSRLEIRKKNALRQGQTLSMGTKLLYSAGFDKALEQFEKSDFYKEMTEHPEPGTGYGIAAALKSSGMGKNVPDTAIAEIEKTEKGYIVRIGVVDIGQGSETALGMIAAEALGVPPESIEMRMGDTEQTEDSGSTAASRSTYVCGNAILLAAEKIRAGQSRAKAEFSFPEIEDDRGVHSMFGFIVQGVQVKTDPVTGQVKVLKAFNVTEAGRIIHPGMMAGQIYGGIVMSQGYVLSEQLRYRDGIGLEDSFNSYVMPTAMDAPHLANENVPFEEETGPYGAKGVAEIATVAMAPAIGAALHSLYPTLHFNHLPIGRMDILHHSRME